MEFDEIIVKESPGLCRCCLSEGCYKDLGTEYTWMNDTEVYADMLLECFDIGISQHNEGPNGPNRLICEVCITRLRDACNFKKQVLESEKRFVDMVGRGDFAPKVVVYPAMKPEVVSEEVLAEDAEVEYLEEDLMDYDDKLPIPESPTPETSDDMSLATLKVKNKRGRPRKTATVEKPEKKTKIAKTEDKPRTSKDVNPVAEANELKRRNLQILFNNTSIIPFKWRGKYRCFYCNENQNDYKDFRNHTNDHGVSDKDQTIRSLKIGAVEVKIDVSDVTCRICNESFITLNEIVMHLIFKHKLSYNKDVDLRLTTYRLAGVKCLYCEETFDNSSNLMSHMSSNHPNSNFTCTYCNEKFDKDTNLEEHFKSHYINAYSCVKCTLTFPTYVQLKTHKDNAHSSVCNVCLKTLASTVDKLKHMDQVHKVDGIWKCELCLRSTRSKQVFFSHASYCNSKQKTVPIPREYTTMKKEKATTKKAKATSRKVKTEKVAELRDNMICIFRMSTAIPFKYFRNKFRCYYCPTNFPECEELRQHVITAHPKCEKYIKTMSRLRSRLDDIVKIDTSSLSCKVCLNPMSDMDTLINHIISEHKAKYDKSVPNILQPFKLIKDSFACPFCDKVYRYFHLLLAHVNQDHAENRKICLHCGKALRSTTSLNSHMYRQHKGTRYNCTYCASNFMKKLSLQVHLGRIHGEKSFKCPLCTEKFLTTYFVQTHMMNVHGTGFKCSLCDNVFASRSFLTSHVRRLHLNEKNVECSICSRRFYDARRLNTHMVMHTGELRFECDVCDKKFLRKRTLRKHLRIHTRNAAS